MKNAISLKYLLVNLSLTLCLSNVQAQIVGNIILSDASAAEYINVQLYKSADSIMIGGAISDKRGEFSLNIENPNTYYIKINFIGYEDVFIDGIEYTGSELRLEPVTLVERRIEIEGVEVTAKKIQIGHTKEGMVVNVQSSLLTKGSSILQLIERMPGVVIDRRNGDLRLNGQSGALILINGKPQQMSIADLLQLLNGMDGSNVEKIELITNPSAKYDAEGGAIINVILGKSDLEGTNGAFSINTGRGWGNKYGGNVNINHKQSRWNIYGNLSMNYDDSFSDWHGVGSSVVPVLSGFNRFDFTSENGVETKSQNLNLGAELDLLDKTIVGASFGLNRSDAAQATNNLAINTFFEDSVLISRIQRTGNNKWINGSANGYIRKIYEDKSSIAIDMDYIFFDIENPNEINNDYLDKNGDPTTVNNDFYAVQNRGTSATNIDVGIVKLDYEKEINSTLKFDSGVKTSYSTTENSASISRLQNDEWTVDDRTITKQSIQEFIVAGYLSMDYSINEKASIAAGMRYENWSRDFTDDDLDRNFGRFFPTLSYGYKTGEFSNIQLSYNRRISRPTYNDLASYLSYNGPLSVFTGNSQLLATITDNVKIDYQNGGKNFSLFYSNESNPIARYQISRNDDANVALITPQNVKYQRSVGIQSYLSFELSNRWNLNFGGSISNRTFEVNHTEIDKKLSYIAFDLNGNSTLDIGNNFSAELSGWYVSNHYNGSISVKGFGVINLGFKKDFGYEYGSIQFSVNDIFQTMRIRSFIGELTDEAFSSLAEVYYKAESGNNRIYKLTYSMSFGSKKVRSQKIKKSSNEEEGRVIK